MKIEYIKNGWIKNGVLYQWLENPTRLVSLPLDALQYLENKHG